MSGDIYGLDNYALGTSSVMWCFFIFSLAASTAPLTCSLRPRFGLVSMPLRAPTVLLVCWATLLVIEPTTFLAVATALLADGAEAGAEVAAAAGAGVVGAGAAAAGAGAASVLAGSASLAGSATEL